MITATGLANTAAIYAALAEHYKAQGAHALAGHYRDEAQAHSEESDAQKDAPRMPGKRR